MKISLDNHASGYLIQGYDSGEIRVRGPAAAGSELLVYRQSVLVTPERLADWEPQSFDELAGEHFSILGELRPEVILLGSGERMRLPTTPLLAALAHLGVGFEVMDTGAACRTYNLLAGESRRVLAALFVS